MFCFSWKRVICVFDSMWSVLRILGVAPRKMMSPLSFIFGCTWFHDLMNLKSWCVRLIGLGGRYPWGSVLTFVPACSLSVRCFILSVVLFSETSTSPLNTAVCVEPS